MNHAAEIGNQSSIQADGGALVANDTRQSATHQKNLPFLSVISNAALQALTSNAELRYYSKQAVIVSANNETKMFYIILSGRVRLFISDASGKEVTLSFQEPGTHFGEVALLTKDFMSVSVMALQKTICAVISKTDFFVWLLAYPEATFILLTVMSEQIKQLTAKVKQMSLLDTYGRLMAILEGLAVNKEDARVVYDMPSQQTLASMAGVSRKTINKAMSDLIQGGYVHVKDKRLYIQQKQPRFGD